MKKKSLIQMLDSYYTKMTQRIIGDIPLDTQDEKAETQSTDTQASTQKLSLKERYKQTKSRLLNVGTPKEEKVLYSHVVNQTQEEVTETPKDLEPIATTLQEEKVEVKKIEVDTEIKKDEQEETTQEKSEKSEEINKSDETQENPTTPKPTTPNKQEPTIKKQESTAEAQNEKEKISENRLKEETPTLEEKKEKLSKENKPQTVTKPSTQKETTKPKTTSKQKETTTQTKDTSKAKKATTTKTTKRTTKKETEKPVEKKPETSKTAKKDTPKETPTTDKPKTKATTKKSTQKKTTDTKTTTKKETTKTAATKPSKREQKITLYTADIKKHYGEVDEAFLTIIVKNLGPSVYRKDAELVSCSDPKELDTVRKNFLIKKLGLNASKSVLDAAISDVCQELKSAKNKYRATFYYALAKKFKKESVLS